MVFAAVAQFCATNVIKLNLEACVLLIAKAAQRQAKMIFLPEASDFISTGKKETLSLTEPLENSIFVSGIKDAAQKEGIWVSLGIHEPSSSPDRVYNTHLIINSSGHLISSYRKLHLFDVDIAEGPQLLESLSTAKGDRIADPIETPVGKLGPQICYDLRFSEVSIAQRARGAELLAFPSAFTIKTGLAHWEVLLRARAIDTQCYVLAAAQIGQHNAKRASYGDAMIIDPWGTVVARCPGVSSPTIAIADIDLEYMYKIRREMPVMSHRRTDIYPVII